MIDKCGSGPVAVLYVQQMQFLKLSEQCHRSCEVPPIVMQFTNDLTLTLNALFSLGDMPLGQR